MAIGVEWREGQVSSLYCCRVGTYTNVLCRPGAHIAEQSEFSWMQKRHLILANYNNNISFLIVASSKIQFPSG